MTIRFSLSVICSWKPRSKRSWLIFWLAIWKDSLAKLSARLDELMHLYRRGLVRKAQALKVAVERGLRPPLS